MSPKDFFNKYKYAAIYSHVYSGVPASVTLAQAALESSYGESELTQSSNNFFGIKAFSNPKGWPVVYAFDVEPNQPFRAYPSPRASFRDHAYFLTRENDRYKWLLNYQDYKTWANGLESSGYAAPGYSAKLLQIIEANNLQRLDTYGAHRFLILAIILIIAAVAIIFIVKLTLKSTKK